MYNPWDVDGRERKESGRGARTGAPMPVPPIYVVGLLWVFALAIWIGSGFYQVDLGSVAVVTRLGRVVESVGPGWHYHLPMPFEKIYKCNTAAVQQLRGSGSVNTITGDRNLVDVSYTVQWRIHDPIKWIFHVRGVEKLISLSAGACMRDAVNGINIDDALAEGRHKIELMVKENLQKMLDSYNSGVFVQEVTLRRLDPPKDVADAFYDVEKAWADHHHVINQAEAFSNEAIPQARAKASQTLEKSEAEAYKMRQMSDAEAMAFDKIQSACQGEGRFGGERYLSYDALRKVLSEKRLTVMDGSVGTLPVMPVVSEKPRKEEA